MLVYMINGNGDSKSEYRLKLTAYQSEEKMFEIETLFMNGQSVFNSTEIASICYKVF